KRAHRRGAETRRRQWLRRAGQRSVHSEWFGIWNVVPLRLGVSAVKSYLSHSDKPSTLLHYPPHVPRAEAAIRPPRRRDAFHRLSFGQLTQAIQLLHALAHTVIADRQDVRAAERKNHQHVRRPLADAMHGRHGRN